MKIIIAIFCLPIVYGCSVGLFGVDPDHAREGVFLLGFLIVIVGLFSFAFGGHSNAPLKNQDKDEGWTSDDPGIPMRFSSEPLLGIGSRNGKIGQRVTAIRRGSAH